MRRDIFIYINMVLIVIVISLSFLVPHRPDKSQIKTSDAYEALNFWSAQRAYPDRTIPDVGHFKVYMEERRRVNGRLNKQIFTKKWESIGPHNIGGRTNAIEINPLNPNTIYAGSASGGLWRSFTGGVGADAWEYVDTGFPVLGIGAIAISPDDTSTIYIGTGEVYAYQNSIGGLADRTTRGSYGIGILKSTDNGQTWIKSLDWSYNQKRGVWAIEIDPSNSDIVWAGTTEGTYKSTDGGASWTRVDTTIMVMDLVIHPQNPDTVFIACGNFKSSGYGIYRTTNGGTSWTKLTFGLPSSFEGKIQLSIYQRYPDIIYASIGNGYWDDAGSWLCRSVDGGNTWSIVSEDTDFSSYQGWYSHCVGVSPVDSNVVFVGGVNLWKSTDGGSNLKQINSSGYQHGVIPIGGPEGPSDYVHCDFHDIVFHPTDPDIIYFGCDGGVFRTTDGGTTFEGCNGRYQTTQFYNGCSSSRTDSLLFIGGMQDNYSAIYRGSKAWNRVLYGDGCYTAIHPTNSNIIYGSPQYLLYMYRSIDGGNNWSYYYMPAPYDDDPCFVSPFVLSPSNPKYLYAAHSRLYLSIDGGKYWFSINGNEKLDGNPIIALAISEQTDKTLYAATVPKYSRSHIYYTTNYGAWWHDITKDLPDRYPVDIAVDPTNDKIVYVIFSGFGSSHVYKTTDRGKHWKDIGSGLPDVPTSAVAVDPLYTNNIYVGNDLGVYVSLDGGENWKRMSEGLPEGVIVMDLSISPVNRVIRAATHGNGVYECKLFNYTSSDDESSSPESYLLYQNYPNPFNSQTEIRFTLPKLSHVRIDIYDVRGRKIETVIDEYLPQGSHFVKWTASGLPSGVYLYRMRAGDYIKTRRMVFQK